MGTSTLQNGSTLAGLASDSVEGQPKLPGRVVLRSILGSQAYGLATESSDVDRAGVFITPRRELARLRPPAETVVQTDPDFSFHEIGKFFRLALKCNPTILEQLYVEPEFANMVGRRLRAHRDIFLSTPRVVGAFGGYAMDQINRLQRRGDSFSSDTRKRYEKHARHCFRLLWQGRELLETGTLTVRLSEEQANELFAIGALEPTRLIARFNVEDEIFKASASKSVLKDKPNYETAEALLGILRDMSDE